MNPVPKIKSLPTRRVKITRENFPKLRKKGTYHAHFIHNIDINVGEIDRFAFFGKILKEKECDQYTKEIYKVLQFRSVKRLQYTSSDITQRGLSQLAGLLRRLCFRGLEYLSIKTRKSSEVRDKDFKPVIQNVRQLTKLKTLHLRLFSFPEVKGTYLAPMTRTLHILDKLRNFKFAVNEAIARNKSESLSLLSKSLKSLNPQRITNLSLAISRININLTSFFNEVGDCIERFQKLKSLSINFHWNNINPDAVSSFMTHLSLIKSLTTLRFHYINDRCQPRVLKEIAKLQNLKSIYLTLFCPNNKNLLMYAESLRQLSSLEEFSLSLLTTKKPGSFRAAPDSNEEIDDNTLTILCNALQIHASRLCAFELIIVLRDRPDIPLQGLTCKGFSAVADLIANCTKLEHLELICVTQQDEASLIKLFQSMLNASHLKSLFLNLRGDEDTTDALLDLFGKVLLNNLKLSELNIFFEDLYSITDQGVARISESFSNLQALRLVKLEFQYFPNLTNKTLHGVVRALKNVRSLEQAELCFGLEPSKTLNKPILGPLTDGNIKVDQTMIIKEVKKRFFNPEI